MPALDPTIVKDLTSRLVKYLADRGNYSAPCYLTSGGSAAVFKAESVEGVRAFKVFDPRFFEGEVGEAERQRLEVQRRLIAHECPSLIQTFHVQEAYDTAIVEMEFVSWSDLNKVLEQVPDTEVSVLIKQLVLAARFLEEQGIVHRDIKPENIKISPDFKHLKLLDLGVARNIEVPDNVDAAVTDHGNLRPFLATAQYSSPEYLFRLDEPSARLWKGLNFYQIGAVLHDLIMKKQIFDYEMRAGNRWLVSKAVLTKIPSFEDVNTNRLRSLKALAARCLAKNLELRLQIVGWEDFMQEDTVDPINVLRARLARSRENFEPQANAAAHDRLEFERNSFTRSLSENVRDELIAACGTSLPSIVRASTDRCKYTYEFTLQNEIVIQCQVSVIWFEGIYARDAQIKIAALLCHDRDNAIIDEITPTPVCQTSVDSVDDTTVNIITSAIAKSIGVALDIINTVPDIDKLEPTNLMEI
ncbi:MAG: protein kinase [Candidatus Obscuribacterales bacterium]|nr:protein kinase [Candidatus Obscuribacterales bacterium]